MKTVWPQWDNDTIAIVAGGPSAATADLEKLKMFLVKHFAIGKSIELCPWADAVYACDGSWWHHRAGLPEFTRWKFTNDGTAARRYGLRKVTVKASTDRLLFDEPGTIGGGGCSGFQALNLALQFGTRRIILIGFDMSDDDRHERIHWYGRNAWPGSWNPSRRDFARWRRALDNARYDKRCLIINASERSALTAFPKMNMDAAIACMHLA